MEGPTATYEEVQAEFAKRFAQIEYERKIKAQKKAAMKAMKSGAAYTGYKASHRSAGGGDEEEEVQPIRFGTYQAVGSIDRRINTIFSKESPEDILDFLGVYAGKNCSKFEFAKSKAKVTMRFLLENEEEVSIRARLSKVEAEDVFALEFNRVCGNHKDYIEKMEGLIDAMGDIACEEV